MKPNHDLLFNPSNVELRADPFATFARLQDEAPCFFNQQLGGWMLTRYDDVVAAFRDPRLSADRISPFMRGLAPDRRQQMQPLWQTLGKWSVFADPPQHTRLRGLFQRAFGKQAMLSLRANIRQLVQHLLERISPGDEIDFVERFAYPLPAMVICDLLGLPHDDIQKIRDWSDDIATFIGLPIKPAHTYDLARAANDSLSEYFSGWLGVRRAQRGRDLISTLLEAAEQDEATGDAEIIATCGLLLFAAHTTTTHMLANGVLALLRYPEQMATLRAEAELIPGAVEELMRFDGPIQTVRRQALESFELHGQRLEAGDIVFLMINAANRDPRRFENPQALDVRQGARQQIAFGVGHHFCAGATLARVEGQEALAALLAAPLRFELGAHAPEDWLDSFGFRGLTRLPLRVLAR
jgi:cytochrome P450